MPRILATRCSACPRGGGGSGSPARQGGVLRTNTRHELNKQTMNRVNASLWALYKHCMSIHLEGRSCSDIGSIACSQRLCSKVDMRRVGPGAPFAAKGVAASMERTLRFLRQGLNLTVSGQAREDNAASVYGYTGTLRANGQGTSGQALIST
jgi:hypothetical protein